MITEFLCIALSINSSGLICPPATVANGKTLVACEEDHIIYQLPDGRFEMKLSSAPLGFPTDDGFMPYDMSFVPCDDGYISKSSLMPLRIKERELSFSSEFGLVLGENNENLTIEGNHLRYGEKSIWCGTNSISIETKRSLVAEAPFFSEYSFVLGQSVVFQKEDDGLLFQDIQRHESYKLTYPYLSNDFGNFVFPSGLSLKKDGQLCSVSFAFDNLSNLEGLYDEEAIVTYNSSSGNASLIDKVITLGSAACTTGNVLSVGKTGLLGEYGETIEYQMVTKATLPNIDLTYFNIDSAELRYRRKNGSLSTLSGYLVQSPSYESLDGLVNPSLSPFGATILSGSYFSFDVTSTIENALGGSLSSVTLLFKGFSQGAIANLYSASSSIFPPTLHIVYSNYGSATPFPFENHLVMDTNANCFGYALYGPGAQMEINGAISNACQGNIITYSLLSSFIDDYFTSYIDNSYLTNPIAHRIIGTYNTLIYANERRIAFAVLISGGNYLNYHFMRQCSDGSWSAKEGVNGTYGVYEGEESVLNQSNWLVPYGCSLSAIVYLAIQGV